MVTFECQLPEGRACGFSRVVALAPCGSLHARAPRPADWAEMLPDCWGLLPSLSDDPTEQWNLQGTVIHAAGPCSCDQKAWPILWVLKFIVRVLMGCGDLSSNSASGIWSAGRRGSQSLSTPQQQQPKQRPVFPLCNTWSFSNAFLYRAVLILATSGPVELGQALAELQLTHRCL
jgi:hypothetical protein